MNREFVLLAKTLETDIPVSGLYMSIKLDGQRCIWDGGVSRGVPKPDIPWANNDKDGRYRSTPICTGLWSRYGNVIHAPDWFIDDLPKGIMLDGELYLGRGRFQESRKIVSTLEPGYGWKDIKFHVFDMPSPRMLFSAGKINNPNMTKYIQEEVCLDVVRKAIADPSMRVEAYKDTLVRLYSMQQGQYWSPCVQVLLPESEERAKELLSSALEAETKLGGEGLMLRYPDSIWHPKRSDKLLKVKKLEMDDAEIIGYESGTGKLSGMFGSLVVRWKGKVFQLSGFTDVERELDAHGQYWAKQNEGTRCPDWVKGVRFKIGSFVRFTYRTLTDEGIPREARYLR